VEAWKMASKKKLGLSTVVLLASTVGALPATADEPRENPTIEQPANRAAFGRRGQGDKVNRLREMGTRKAALAGSFEAGQKLAVSAAERVEPVAVENKAAITAAVSAGRGETVQGFMSQRKMALTAKDAGEVNHLTKKTVESRLVSEKAPQKSAMLAPDAAAAPRDNPEQSFQKK